MKSMLTIILISLELMASRFETVSSEFPEGTIPSFTNAPNTTFFGKAGNEIFVTFANITNTEVDRLFRYDDINEQWLATTNYSKSKFGQIRKVLKLRNRLIIWTQNGIYFENTEGMLEQITIPFKEYPNSINPNGYQRRIVDLAVKDNQLIVGSEFGQKIDLDRNTFVYLSELLYLGQNFEAVEYFRTHSELFEEYNDVDSIPKGITIQFLHVLQNGDLIATGTGTNQVNSQNPYLLRINS